MPLTLAQKSNVRRHMGYPVTGLPRTNTGGGSLASGNAGYRYFEAWGQLEYRMNNLGADEESRLLGVPYGALALVGINPNPGDTISVTFTGGTLASPVTIIAVALPNDTPLIFLDRLASLASVNQALVNAGFQTFTPYGSGIYSYNAVPVPEIAFTNQTPFTMAVSATGSTAPQITADGKLLSPSASLDGITTIWGYLPILDGLENALAGTSQNLDTIQADVWKARANEQGQRTALYLRWVKNMANFLGLPTNRMRHESMGGPRASGLM